MKTTTDDSLLGNRFAMTKDTVLVVYSTQSGTSEELGQRLCNSLINLTGDEEVCSMTNISDFDEMDDLEIRQLIGKYKILIFFISSYGQGEPCDDGILFFDRLNGKSKGIFNGLKYSMFGCGNSYYDDYQAAAIQLNDLIMKNNEEVEMIGEFGLGDEAQNSILDDYDSWMFDYITVLSKKFEIKITQNSEYVEIYKIVPCLANNSNVNVQKPPYHDLKPFHSSLDLESFKNYSESYIHFEVNLDIQSSKLKYQSGDHVGIYPVNDVENVEKLIEIIGEEDRDNSSFKIALVNRMDSNIWNGKIFNGLKEMFSKYVEINRPLSRKVIKDFLTYIIKKDSECRKPLQEIIKSKEIFTAEILNKRITFVDIFQKFDIIRNRDYDCIPVSFILENFGPLKPRLFSITSSNMVDSNKVGVVMKIIKDKSFTGVCSNTIEKIRNQELPNDVSIYINKSKFKLPIDLSRPLIFVGAGTGIAPFRGFLQEICSSKMKMDKVNKITVYFGLRDIETNFIYKESFDEYQEKLGEDKLQIRVAVSGIDGNNSKGKVYVQDLIREDENRIVHELLEDKGYIYVCGDAGGMSKGVKKAVTDVLGQGSSKVGDQKVQYLQSMGRYREDVW